MDILNPIELAFKGYVDFGLALSGNDF